MSLKQNRIIKIVMEFVKAEDTYDITGIDLGLAKFFYREPQMLFQDLAKGDYTISTNGGKQTLTITNPELLAKIEVFQVAYVLDFDASKYDTQWNVDINTLKDKYNQLLDVTFNVWEYVRKIGFVADDTDMQIILPQLNTGEVWVKTDAGWRGLDVGDIESNINAFWIEFNKKTQEILEQIVAAGKVQEGLLEDFTQQKIKEINEEGLKLEVTQVGHGFVFDAVQFDKTTGAYTKADVNTGADGIAVRIDDDRFYLSSNGIIEIPANAVDSKGNPYELDEYYFLDNDIVGGCTPEKPTHIFQALFCVVNKKGVKSALVEIGDPIDLNPRILVDEINSLGLATTDQVVLSEPTIADLIASKKYKIGDVVLVQGYYTKGDGAGHQRQKKPVGYNGADAVIGADGSIWGIVHSGEVKVSWFGAKGDYVSDSTSYIKKAVSYCSNLCVLFIDKGVFRFTETLILPQGITIKGVGQTKIASFPQYSGDKSLLRQGYKHLISGSNIIFTGVTTTEKITNRSDKFSSIKPMVMYDNYEPCYISNVSFLQDMDVFDVQGNLTTKLNDNRAIAYNSGLYNTSTLSILENVTIFGYYDNAGYICHNQSGDTKIDPDYTSLTNCLITGGVAIIGHDTQAGVSEEGLTGNRFTACGIYGADHHTRVDGIYTVPAIYIDGFLTSAKAGIRGHSFMNCNIRTYANDAISLDHCDDIQFIGCVSEFSRLVGVANADIDGGFVGTKNTKNISVIGMGATGDLRVSDFIKQIEGKFVFSLAGHFDDFMVGANGSGVRVSNDTNTGDSFIQLSDNLDSINNGWKIRQRASSGNLEMTHDNILRFSVDKNGGIVKGFSARSGGSVALSNGNIVISSYGYYSVSHSNDNADLTTINGGEYDGQLLILRQATTVNKVTLKDNIGNLRLVGDCMLGSSQNRIMLQFDGTNWVEISRSLNS